MAPVGWLRGWTPRLAVYDRAPDGPTPTPMPAAVPPPPLTPIEAKLAAARAARMGVVVATPDQALGHSVVNRARDLLCGILSDCPFTRVRERGDNGPEDLGPGWLSRPDPTRTRAGFVAAVSHDLFFHGWALVHVTARDTDGFPLAVEHMPWVDAFPLTDVDVIRWFRRDLLTGAVLEELTTDRSDVITFESPVTGVLSPGSASVVTIGVELDAAARRFASTETAAGILEDDPANEPMTEPEALALVQGFQAARRENTIAYLRGMKYHESTLDPSRLQLVEGRAYQDAAIARVCNVPNYAVGVGVPNDSMTYKTAATARWDLLDFGLAPLVGCWEQTLSGDDVVPHGTRVEMDLSGFLHSLELAQAAAVAGPQPLEVSAR